MIESSIDLLYEDNHIIVVNKPAGLLSQPTNLENDSLETRVKAWIKSKYQKLGNVFVGVIHRLDRPVSGILVFAKTSKALSRLNEAIRSKEMQKTYYALVEGIPLKTQDSLTHFLVHGEHTSYISHQHHQEAKEARLHYEVIKEWKKNSLLQVVLETGRYHQIRCQLAGIGHPIVGDRRYGAKKEQQMLVALPPNAIALHHIQLSLIHPVTKTPLTIEAPLPSYFQKL